MVYPFLCGGAGLQRMAESDTDEPFSPRSTGSPPRKSRRSSLGRSKDKNNPYADRGLDKFSALLAELDQQRQKIYTESGRPDQISMVRFAFSDSNRVKPIVVRSKERQSYSSGSSPPNETQEAKRELIPHKDERRDQLDDEKTREQKSFSWRFMLGTLRRPSWYFPLAVILILILLTFGRSFAILCTSLGWYLIPTINGGSSSSKRHKKKKEHARKKVAGTGDGLASPTSVISGPACVFSPGRRGQKKSW
ncbi:hypothetical protein NMG60_11031247 [Bertholletia excelsa]